MQFIDRIEIKHFRSIYQLEITDLSDINVFSGVNDVGKSNVIKALNLFFNNQVDWQTPLDLELETNSFLSNTSRARKKGKDIHVKLLFNRPRGRYETSLGEKFWILRKWNKHFPMQPETTWGNYGESKARKKRPRAITEILNRSHFFYVPAIRGQDYFRFLIKELADAFASRQDESLETVSNHLSKAIAGRNSDLIADLEQVTGLSFKVRLPPSIQLILESAGFDTEGNIPLRMRGDGIQGMTVPAILANLSALEENDYYYWGFEEPENSLEYSKSLEFQDKLCQSHSKRSQIFLTTHSPAFLAMQNDRTTIYRLSQKSETYHKTGYSEAVTEISPVVIRGTDHLVDVLHDELGIFHIARTYNQQMRQELEDKEAENAQLRQENESLTEPTLIVEGKHDKQTLEHAWARLHNHSMPFKIEIALDAKRVTKRVVSWIESNKANRLCALYDNDNEGNEAFDKLPKKTQNTARTDGAYAFQKFMYGDLIMAFTLPTPPGREAQAKNRNMTLEFYFPDSELMRIHNEPGGQLFKADKYIVNGMQSWPPDKDGLDTMLKSGNKTIVHRQVIEPGKTRLVQSLCDMPDKYFRVFHCLFSTVVAHLVRDDSQDAIS